MSQLRGLFRRLYEKRLTTVAPLRALNGVEPVGAGWLMNKSNFVARRDGLEGDFEHEVKKGAGCGGLPRLCAEGKARADSGAIRVGAGVVWAKAGAQR
jgi:hypothetical protein